MASSRTRHGLLLLPRKVALPFRCRGCGAAAVAAVRVAVLAVVEQEQERVKVAPMAPKRIAPATKPPSSTSVLTTAVKQKRKPKAPAPSFFTPLIPPNLFCLFANSQPKQIPPKSEIPKFLELNCPLSEPLASGEIRLYPARAATEHTQVVLGGLAIDREQEHNGFP